MYNNTPLSTEAKDFLREQAQQLKDNDQLCQLITAGPHTSYYGQIVSVSDGGLVFNEDSTGQQVITPWENVEKFISLTNTANLSRSSTAGR